jgi:hypothetical protein
MVRNGRGHPAIPSILDWINGDPLCGTGYVGAALVTDSAQTGIAFHRVAVRSSLGHAFYHQDKFAKQAVPELCHHLLQHTPGNPWWQIHHIHCSMTAANIECLAITPHKGQELPASRAAQLGYCDEVSVCTLCGKSV